MTRIRTCATSLALATLATLLLGSSVRANNVEIHLDIATHDLLIYQAIPVRVSITNRGPEVLVVSEDAFRGDPDGHATARRAQKGWTWPSVRIVGPDGASIDTAWAILTPMSEDPPHALSRQLQEDETAVWEFLLGVAWDAPEQPPILTHPGKYVLTAVARIGDDEMRSAPREVLARIPTDIPTQRAADVVDDLTGREFQLYYSAEAADQLGRTIALQGRAAAPILYALAEDEHPHPYREYARMALGAAQLQAARYFVLPHHDDALRAAEAIAEAERLLVNVGQTAPELRSRTTMLTDKLAQTKRVVHSRGK